MKRQLAIYDMDRTITKRATYTPFLFHIASRLAPWRLPLATLLVVPLAAYGLKLIGRGRLKEISHRLLIGRAIPFTRLEPVIESFASKQIASNIMPGALASIEADRKAGRMLVMATASYHIYASVIAKKLGFTDVIATQTHWDMQRRVIARIEGSNCYGEVKLAMIQAWLKREGLERAKVHIRFYSDHISDSIVHHWSDEPVAVNAHGRLTRLAKVRGWEIRDWHQ